MKLDLPMKEFTRVRIERVTESILELDWKNPALYGDFLAQTYHHICHSTRLLAAAASRFPLEQESLHLQCMKHSSEEQSHEKLSLSDLKALSLKLEDFPECGATKSLYRTAYYLIDRVSPFSLFGYAYFLEWIAIAGGEPVYEIAKDAYGSKAVKHLHVHTKEDPAHIEAYEKLLDTFSQPDRLAIAESIDTTAYHYEKIYREIQLRAGTIRSRKAA